MKVVARPFGSQRLTPLLLATATLVSTGGPALGESALLALAPTALLPLPGHVQSEARAINASGEVAGFSFDPAPSVAVVWDREGHPTALAPLPGDTSSQALGLNDAGTVVGWSRGEDGLRTGAVWAHDRDPAALPPLPGDTEAQAWGLNTAGMAIGRSHGATGDRAVVWDHAGTPAELARPADDPEGEARAVNAGGTVVGWSKGPPDASGSKTRTALAWHQDGSATSLQPLPPNRDSLAIAINAAGMVVGEVVREVEDSAPPARPACLSIPGSLFTAIVWDETGMPRALPALPGDGHSAARGVSTSGIVVGQTENRGVLWGPDDAPIELPPLPGDRCSRAEDVNAAGVVVGVSWSDSGQTAVVWR